LFAYDSKDSHSKIIFNKHLEIFWHFLHIISPKKMRYLLFSLVFCSFFLCGASQTINWYLIKEAYSLIAGINSTIAQIFFSDSNTYSGVGAAGNNTFVSSFTSFVSFQAAINTSNIPPTVSAVIYDCENWTFTPSNEQLNFGYYFQQFCNLAHQNNLKCILTPATDLTNTNSNCQGQTSYDKYLACNISTLAARAGADILEIQAQDDEINTNNFYEYILLAGSAAKAINPNIQIWAGLSTNPSGKNVTGQMLFDSFNATFPDLAIGYWLNVPQNGSYCPKCGIAQPQVAVDFLEMILQSPFSPLIQPSTTSFETTSSNGTASTGSVSTGSSPSPSHSGSMIGCHISLNLLWFCVLFILYFHWN
jgi:hypothetical protein